MNQHGKYFSKSPSRSKVCVRTNRQTDCAARTTKAVSKKTKAIFDHLEVGIGSGPSHGLVAGTGQLRHADSALMLCGLLIALSSSGSYYTFTRFALRLSVCPMHASITQELRQGSSYVGRHSARLVSNRFTQRSKRNNAATPTDVAMCFFSPTTVRRGHTVKPPSERDRQTDRQTDGSQHCKRSICAQTFAVELLDVIMLAAHWTVKQITHLYVTRLQRLRCRKSSTS